MSIFKKPNQEYQPIGSPIGFDGKSVFDSDDTFSEDTNNMRGSIAPKVRGEYKAPAPTEVAPIQDHSARELGQVALVPEVQAQPESEEVTHT